MFNDEVLFTNSTTADGNMGLQFGTEQDVLLNRRRFLEKHRINPKNFCLMQCDHGEQIIVVNNDNVLAS